MVKYKNNKIKNILTIDITNKLLTDEQRLIINEKIQDIRCWHGLTDEHENIIIFDYIIKKILNNKDTNLYYISRNSINTIGTKLNEKNRQLNLQSFGKKHFKTIIN